MTTESLPHTKHLMLTGIVLIVFGIIAIATPAVAGKAVVLVIGGVLLVSGLLQIVQGFRADSWSRKLPPLIFGALTGLFAIAVLAHPLLGLKFLTLLLVAYFVVAGISKVIASFAFRPVSSWLLMLGSGLISLLLGVLIWQQWPLSGLWAVGILVGIDLLITGISMVSLATTVGRYDRLTAAGGVGLPHQTPT